MSLSARKLWIEIGGKAGDQTGSEWSLSARKLWIEIASAFKQRAEAVSLSARKLWIEIQPVSAKTPRRAKSLSARKLWIEIPQLYIFDNISPVAFCEEAVD